MTSKNICQLALLILILSFSGCKQEKEYNAAISEEITFKNNKKDIRLSGTLMLPSNDGVFPAVILISGNGEHNRDEEFGQFKPFLDLSNYLAQRGIAVLRYDKRGVEKSTGNYDSATSFDFANDVVSAIDYLLTRKEINKEKIGLIGHSEGGLIAPIVASNSSNVAFIISLAGPSLSGDKTLLMQQKAIASAKGIDPSEIERNQKLNRDAFEIVNRYKNEEKLQVEMRKYIERISLNDPDQPENMTYEEYVEAQLKGILNPWMVNFLRYNPQAYIEKVKCPVLALNGAKDLQVLASEHLPEWERILESAGNKHTSTKELQNLNHLFQTCETGLPDEYEKLDESFSPKAMIVITDWIKKQL